MPSINLDVNYRRHPKTKRLVARLGKGAEPIPVWLWSYCGEFHASTGEITGITPEDLEHEIGWRGNRGECIKALEEEGFLEPLERGWLVHDFLDRNGHIHAYHLRAKKARAAQLGRIADTSPPPSSPDKPATSRASSAALAVQREEIQSPLPPKGGEGTFLDRPELRKRWETWCSLRRKRFKRGEAEECVAFLEGLNGEAAAVACLQDAIDNGLVQLRKPKATAPAESLGARLTRRVEKARRDREEEERLRVEFQSLPTIRELLAARQQANGASNGNGVNHP